MTAVRKLIKYKWLISFALNIIALFVILLFFEITPKSDDYSMTAILYGAFSDGEYSEFLMYVNIIIGFICKWLLQIFPNVAWYYILQYILMVACFSFILRIVLERVSTKCALIYWAIMMPICVYDFYSTITFTKTAALLMAAGLICLLYAIGNNKVLFYIMGALFVTFGILYRSALFEMELVCFIPSFVLEIKHLWNTKKALIKTVIKFAVVIIALFVIYDGARDFRSYMYANSEWSNFFEYNSLRSQSRDYPLLDYEENKDLYEENGVTESELLMWITYNNKVDITVEDYEKLAQMVAPASERNLSIGDFFNTLINQLRTNLEFYVFLIFLIFLILSKNKDKWWLLICVCGVMVACIFVMYYRGRLQDHTNAAVIFACSLQLIYYADGLPDKKYKPFVFTGIIYMLAILYNYDSLTTSQYYLFNQFKGMTSYKDYLAEAYKDMKLMSDDKEHFYLMSPDEYNHIYQCFPPLTVIPQQFYSNISGGGFGICNVEQEKSLDAYGLYIPYRDMVDNLDAYCCFTDWTDYQIEGIADYIKYEHGIECTPVLLKQMEDIKLYRYCSHDLILEDIDYIDDTSDITYQIDIDIVDDELDISGYAYIEGEDSFAQNIYVLLEDPETDEDYYYYTLQTENESLKYEDKYNGKYSDFSASIDLQESGLQELQESGLQEYLIYVILEVNNNYYKIAVG